MTSKINIAIADDHALLRKGLMGLLNDAHYEIKLEAENGKDLIQQLEKNGDIHVVLMDLNMPVMDGFETTVWLNKNKPAIKVLALTMSNDDKDIIKMLRAGAHGYLLKDTEPQELKHAIDEVIRKGFYYSELISGKLIHSMNHAHESDRMQQVIDSFAPHEMQYIQHACSDLTHKEISVKMNISPRTVDGYRDQVYAKTNIQSRVGLVLFAIRHGIFRI